MTEKEAIREALSALHASEGTLEEVFKIMANENNQQTRKPVRRAGRRVAIVAIAAVLVLGLSVSALAATGIIHFDHSGTPEDFYDGAFGTGVPGQEAFYTEITDAQGNVLKTEHYPKIERVEADPAQAAALVGDKIIDVDAGVTFGDINYILRSIVQDENGIGVLTFEIQNPKGYDPDDHMSWLTLSTASGRMMDEESYLQSVCDDGTSATFVCYFTPFEDTGREDLALEWLCRNGKDVERVPMAVSVENAVPARAFAAGGVTAAVSPLGITLRYDEPAPVSEAISAAGAARSPVPTPEPQPWGERIEQSLVLRYADGSEYVVMGEDLVGFAVSARNHDDTVNWFAFNRLADADSVTEIALTWDMDDGYGNSETVDRILLPK